MALHRALAEGTGLAIYFADPHSPWQRGICENTNDLLRQYLPKGTDLSVHSQRQLDAIAWDMSTRPCRTLHWRSPAEVFFEYYLKPRDRAVPDDALGGSLRRDFACASKESYPPFSAEAFEKRPNAQSVSAPSKRARG